MHLLTSFVRSRTAALADRIRWRLEVVKAALSLRPVRGAEGEGGEGGGGEGGGSPAGGSEGGEGGGEPDKTFTQADLDRIVSERLARDRKDRPSDDELAQLREKAQKFDETEAENQSELDRQKKRADEAEQRAQEAVNRANDALRKAAIMAAATAEKAIQPEAVHALLKERGFKIDNNGNELAVAVDDDGQVTNAEEVVKAFLSADSNKYLVGTTPNPGPGDGGARDPVPEKDLDEQIAEAEEKGDWATFNRLNALKLGQTKE